MQRRVGAGAKLSAGPTHITTAAEADGLVQHLTSPGRTMPVVVISTPAGRAPFVDAAMVYDRVAGLAEVYVLAGGAVAWQLSKGLPDPCSVYGGASRVYPAGTRWLQAPELAPVRLAFSSADGARTAARLATDALELSAEGHSYVPARPTRSQPASGAVIGTTAGRGLVRLDGGGTATIVPELTAVGVPIERLVAKDMPVAGTLDLEWNRLDVTGRLQSPACLAAYATGDNVLARVDVVTAEATELALLPTFRVRMSAADVAATGGTDLRRLFTVGETVVVCVNRHGGTDPKAWSVSPADVDRTELAPVPAVAVLIDGPPWLIPPKDEPAPAPATVVPQQGGPAEPSAEEVARVAEPRELAEENARLRRDLNDAFDLLEAAAAQEAERKSELRQLHTQLKAAQDELADLRQRNAGVGQILFDDPAEQFRYEVDVAWATRTSPDDKARYPRADYTLGPNFLTSLAAVEGIDRAKICQVVVDVLTGRVHDIPARQTHQLRSGMGGNDPTVTAADGALYWRVSLQHKTPQARRLHYVQNHDGSVLLSSIRKHDDFRP